MSCHQVPSNHLRSFAGGMSHESWLRRYESTRVFLGECDVRELPRRDPRPARIRSWGLGSEPIPSRAVNGASGWSPNGAWPPRQLPGSPIIQSPTGETAGRTELSSGGFCQKAGSLPRPLPSPFHRSILQKVRLIYEFIHRLSGRGRKT